MTGGTLINRFMDYTKVDGAAIGNHDFDYGFDFLTNYLEDRLTTNLEANLRYNDQPIAFPKQEKSKLYSMNNGIKIGAIGLTTVLTSVRSPGWALPDPQIHAIHFETYVKIVK